MNASPTPYDIHQIAYFADHSAVNVWLLLLPALLLLFIIGRLIRRFRGKTGLSREMLLYSLADNALKSLVQATDDLQHGDRLFDQAVLVVKRLLSELEGRDFSALSPQELREFSADCSKSALQLLLDKIYDFEIDKYAAAAELRDPVSAIEQLRALLAAYCRKPQTEAE